ncbi:MAG: hypothetical protein OEW15_05635 [Nitrospirota bacterium]|nr:hypothetical protein [Nitrospirota bacterium]
MRRTAYFHTLCTLLLYAFLCGMPAAGSAADLIVEEAPSDPTHYSSIQAAIDYAHGILTSNATTTLSYIVIVEPGTYAGGITLRSNIPVQGRETMRTIVNGGGSGTAMTASGVTGVSVRNFTFKNASVGISVAANSTVNILNNVFALGSAGSAVVIQGSPSSSVVNNTFIQNGTAVSRDADSVLISNNLFSNNTADISQTSTLATESNISYNFFQPATAPKGANYRPNTSFPDTLPLLVDDAAPDAHLQAASPCIDSGDPTIADPYQITSGTANLSDIGAYGGPYADTIPALVTGITSSATTSAPYIITLNWNASSSYLVGGYRVHYGNAPGTYTGSDAKNAAGAPLQSPVDVATDTTLSLNDLAPATTIPAEPVVSTPQPLNGSLVVSWTAVSGATSYDVHYGIDSVAENVKSVPVVNSTTITGLTNGQAYKVAVSAIAQTTYYVVVTAYDRSGLTRTPGLAHESGYSAEFIATVGPKNESGLSNEVIGLPEIITGYPNLPNSGCFIATAAYGSAEAWPVRILRSFRDRYLLASAPGKAFVEWYYAVSPGLAAFVNAHPVLRPPIQALLAPVVVLAAFATAPALLQFLILLAAGGAALALFSRKGGSNNPSRGVFK